VVEPVIPAPIIETLFFISQFSPIINKLFR
jgi:hypothetical protein